MTEEKKYRVAICLHGLVGNAVGKSYNSYDGAKEVLKLSVKHWFDHVVNVQENTDVDFFTHKRRTDYPYGRLDPHPLEELYIHHSQII